MALTLKTHVIAQHSYPNMTFVAGKVAIGATGAVGAVTGEGFTIARTGAGLYTVTIAGTGGVAKILYFKADVVFATGSNTQDVHTLTHGISTRTFTIITSDAGTVDTAADPPSGSLLTFFAIVAPL